MARKSSKSSDKPATSVLGAELVRLRKRRGWSQAELAKRCRISGPYLSQLEHGVRHPPELLLERLISYLEATSSDSKLLRRVAREARAAQKPVGSGRPSATGPGTSPLPRGNATASTPSTLHLVLHTGYPIDADGLAKNSRSLGVLLPAARLADGSLLVVAPYGAIGRSAASLWAVEATTGHRLFAYRVSFDTPDEAKVDAWKRQRRHLEECGYPILRVLDCSVAPARIATGRTPRSGVAHVHTGYGLHVLEGAPLIDDDGCVVARWFPEGLTPIGDDWFHIQEMCGTVEGAKPNDTDPRRLSADVLCRYLVTSDVYLRRWAGNGSVLLQPGEDLVIRFVLPKRGSYAGITLVYPTSVDVRARSSLEFEYAGGPEHAGVIELKVKDAHGTENLVRELPGTGSIEHWVRTAVPLESREFSEIDVSSISELTVASNRSRVQQPEMVLAIRTLLLD